MINTTFLSRVNSIRTGYANNMMSITVHGTFGNVNMSTQLLDLLAEGGWIRSWHAVDGQMQGQRERKGQRSAVIQLKYQATGHPCVKQMIVDKNKGTFVTRSTMYSNYYGLSTWVVSTSQGLMTDSQARSQGMGGVRVRYLF